MSSAPLKQPKTRKYTHPGKRLILRFWTNHARNHDGDEGPEPASNAQALKTKASKAASPSPVSPPPVSSTIASSPRGEPVPSRYKSSRPPAFKTSLKMPPPPPESENATPTAQEPSLPAEAVHQNPETCKAKEELVSYRMKGTSLELLARL